MRTTTIIAAAAIGTLLLAGCNFAKSDADLIQGAWTCATDQGRGLSDLALSFGKDGKAKMGMKGEMKESIMAMAIDVDVDLDYTLKAKTLSMKATGGKVNKLSVNGEAIDVAAMGGAEGIEKKMAEDMKMEDSTITALDARQLVLKTSDGGTLTCKRPA